MRCRDEKTFSGADPASPSQESIYASEGSVLAQSTFEGDGGLQAPGGVAAFSRGDGQRSLADGAASTIEFGPGSDEESLWYARSGDDLQIDLMGTKDQLTLQDWFDGGGAGIVTASGAKLDTQVARLVSAMATFESNNASFDPTMVAQAPADHALQSAIAAAYH